MPHFVHVSGSQSELSPTAEESDQMALVAACGQSLQFRGLLLTTNMVLKLPAGR
jgi:hypothetical protein